MELLMMHYQLTSFFLLFLCIVINSSTIIPYTSSSARYVCDPKESSALLEFKNTFTLDHNSSYYWCEEDYGQISYPKTETWNIGSKDCCSWDGVECDENGQGHVIELDLSCSWLTGTIHLNSSLFILSHLQRLNLAYNHFNASHISPQFGKLQNLKFLNLSGSFFKGEVPLEISQLSKLISLDLSGNNQLGISNIILNKLAHNLTNIREVHLSLVDLTDIRPISLMNLSLSLESLDLSICGLTGHFPPHIFSFPNLRVLRIRRNSELNGHLPKSNWSKSLEILDLSFTNFSGYIPNTIGEVKSLKYLNLGACNFNGEIPETIGNLTQLTDFYLSQNEFNGTIPSTIVNLVHLISFSVVNNHLTGQLPKSVFNLTYLQSLTVSHNLLSGPLPTCILPSALSNLVELELGYNSLNDTIPSWLFSLPRLIRLDLSHNHFIGFIQDFKSTSLKYLDLSENNLQGGIPDSIYRQGNLTSLNLRSNNLSVNLNMDTLLRLSSSLWWLDLSYNNKLSINSSSNVNYSSVNLYYIAMASCRITEFPYLRNVKYLRSLDLSDNLIEGNVPNWLSELDELQHLDLSHNRLSGGIKVLPLIINLSNILLDFNLFKAPLPTLPPLVQQFSASNNHLYGKIHPSICQATYLLILILSNNSLSGTIPPCLVNMTSLSFLDLEMNSFSGIIPMPPPFLGVFIASNNHLYGEIHPSICQTTILNILNLSNNSLSGTIPPCLVNMTALSVLDLKMNNFSGIIPITFMKDSQLRNLDLNDNQIQGELPESLMHCENLEVLDVGNNKIGGTFPHWLEALPRLRVLILRSNQFYGPINSSMINYSFPNLQIMDLSHNHFSGPLPMMLFNNLEAMKEIEVGKKIFNSSEWWKPYYEDSVVVTLKGNELKLERILTIFKAIDLSNNNFSGEIPISIRLLISLKGLNLSHNKLTGGIPASFGNLTNLEWLDLSSNKLFGKIPNQLADLTFLSILNVSQNQLSGPIPQGNQFATFGNSSYFGNSGLCGFPLLPCDVNHKHPMTNSQMQEEEEEDFRFWLKAVSMGYGSGMVFGIMVGYVVLRIGRPLWVVAMLDGKRMARKIQRSRRNAAARLNRRRNN